MLPAIIALEGKQLWLLPVGIRPRRHDTNGSQVCKGIRGIFVKLETMHTSVLGHSEQNDAILCEMEITSASCPSMLINTNTHGWLIRISAKSHSTSSTAVQSPGLVSSNTKTPTPFLSDAGQNCFPGGFDGMHLWSCRRLSPRGIGTHFVL